MAQTTLTVPTILECAKLSESYAAMDRATKSVFGNPLINNLLPELIYLIRKPIQYRYNITAAIGENATASITIDSVPADDFNIEVFVNDPIYGSISLGSYIKDSSDTTTTILAEHITTELALNGSGYAITSETNIITITARTNLGDTINGNNLSVTADITPANDARVFLAPTRATTGTVYTTTVDDPDLGTIILSAYVQSVTDTTTAIFIASLITSINANIYGYTSIPYLANVALYVVAPTGYGSSINGNDGTIAWNASTNSGNFAGGTDEIGIIPNTLTQFSGGVTAIDDPTLIVTANYLWSLLGVYGLRALSAIGQGGSEVIVIPTGGGTVINIAGQIVELVVGDSSQANPAGSPTPADGDIIVTLNYKVMPNTENVYYQGVPVLLYPASDFNYIAVYGSSTTTYYFSQTLSAGFRLKFDFMKIVSESSGGSGTISNGLQAVYVLATSTQNTITVPELGTFMFAQIRGATYDTSVITQTGTSLDLSAVGGAVASESYLIFYYP